jgi:tetratricopeptide (TPR) repeat protein
MKHKKNERRTLSKSERGKQRVPFPKDFLVFIKRIWKMGAAFIVTLGAVVAAIAAIKGNFTIAATVVAAILIGTLSLICLYILFGYRLGISKRQSSPQARRRTIIGVVTVLILTVSVFATWEYYKSIPPVKIIVLIADFEGDDPQKYDATRTIYEQLNRVTKKYPEVRIERLREVIKADTDDLETTDARKKGADHNASIVLWGRCVVNEENVKVTTHFEVLRTPKALSLRENKQTLTAAVTQFRGFTIQEQLSSEMSYLTLLTLGLVRFEAEDYEGAIARFTDALNQTDLPEGLIDQVINRGDIYFYRAFSYLIKCQCDPERLDRAISDFTKAIEFRPDEYTYCSRGASYYQKGELNEAIADFNKVIEINPNSSLGFYNRAISFSEKNDSEKALADFGRTIALRPNDAHTYNGRGGVYRYKGVLDLELADFDHAVSLDPQFADAYVNRAGIYLEKGEIDRAINDYNYAVNISPDFAPAYHNRGVAYYQKGEYEKATADYDQAEKLMPQYATAFYNQGLAYSKLGNVDAAIASFTKAIEQGHERSAAYNERGLAYKKKGDIDKAINDYNRAIYLEPNDPAAYNNRGLAYAKRDNYDQALTDFNQALRINPQMAEVYTNRGLAYEKKGNTEQAMADYDLAIKLGPDYGAYVNRGNYYNKIEQFDLAIADLSKAIQIHPDKEEAYLNRGISFIKKGDRDHAFQDWLKVLSISKDTETRQKVGQWLRAFGLK